MLQLPYIDALLIHKSQSFPAKVLIYSRSSGNFISSHFLFQIHLPRQKNATHYQITTIQEKTLGKGWCTIGHQMLFFKSNAYTTNKFFFLPLKVSMVDIVLGCPWLPQHQPVINWNSGEILKWSEYCIKECMKDISEMPFNSFQATICSTSVVKVQIHRLL